METPRLSSLYQQLILEHYRNPRNKAEMDEKTVEIHMANPVCGDEIRLQLRIEGRSHRGGQVRRAGLLDLPGGDQHDDREDPGCTR